ncbi:FkbM family methyltransferase [Spirosoma utsteinense]|uniref:FkbM family methyltransferase n=1 Tax=Spirosoma utsteinense TaxID=2585773 RepID=A0ABR6W2E5_9BACT|nr:FkbM family methyltransferase [Spirosoma utsteinense]MBC3784993.1 FkbM family methyltransferase [Spirosoma utsteinense]MBC3790399.1 FkbM family methyltransferase [Spirosoma utsteinense]
MAVTGVNRYFRLVKHIENPVEYIVRKGERRQRDLLFTTKPLPVRFQVSAALYQVFKEIFMADVYEIDALVRTLPAQPVVIDIGANAGFFIVQLLSKINEATVYAYEPMPANVKTLHHTLQQNPRLAKQVKLFQMAVTGQPLDSLDLYAEAEENNQVVASMFAGFNENNTQKITVPCITLTDIIQTNNLQSIDLLKLDCEGSEYDILYNTDPTLVRLIGKMVVEVHDVDTDRNNLAAFDAYLQSLGYTTTHEPINSFCHALEAVRR